MGFDNCCINTIILLLLLLKYPGVAESIDSDIDSLMSILKYGNILPEGKLNIHKLRVCYWI